MSGRHRCMRCGQEFACPAPDICTADYDVLPVIYVLKDGQPTRMEHCTIVAQGENGPVFMPTMVLP